MELRITTRPINARYLRYGFALTMYGQTFTGSASYDLANDRIAVINFDPIVSEHLSESLNMMIRIIALIAKHVD